MLAAGSRFYSNHLICESTNPQTPSVCVDLLFAPFPWIIMLIVFVSVQFGRSLNNWKQQLIDFSLSLYNFKAGKLQSHVSLVQHSEVITPFYWICIWNNSRRFGTSNDHQQEVTLQPTHCRCNKSSSSFTSCRKLHESFQEVFNLLPQQRGPSSRKKLTSASRLLFCSSIMAVVKYGNISNSSVLLPGIGICICGVVFPQVTWIL